MSSIIIVLPYHVIPLNKDLNHDYPDYLDCPDFFFNQANPVNHGSAFVSYYFVSTS